MDNVYFKAASELGTMIAAQGHSLVYGGTKVGLMGELARSVKNHNGEVVGIIPERIKQKCADFEEIDELIVTEDMRQRKGLMEEKSDAFISMPGGFGTLEEISEMITGKQLLFHNKPLVFLNINDFYTPLLEFFEVFYTQKFAKPDYKALYYVTKTPQEAIEYIESYDYEKVVETNKWFKDVQS